MAGGDWKEMMYAAEKGDIGLLKYHIRMGIDPNYQHPEELTTPLIEAARQGQYDSVKYLLENGADPKIKSVWGDETALSVAKVHRHKEIVKLLKSHI